MQLEIGKDEKGSKIKSDSIKYGNSSIINAEGNVILNDIEGNTYFLDNLGQMTSLKI